MNTQTIISISKSATADTSTCGFKNVSEDTLAHSSRQHIRDVRQGINMWCELLVQAGEMHDFTKMGRLGWFHSDFVTGFKDHGWWDMHRKAERHHLKEADGVPNDVNLVDVLEYITDCVMAGKARSGQVHKLEISAEVLMKAFENTAKLLESRVVVHEASGRVTFPQMPRPEFGPLAAEQAGAMTADRSTCGHHKGGVCAMDELLCSGACGEHTQRALAKLEENNKRLAEHIDGLEVDDRVAGEEAPTKKGE